LKRFQPVFPGIPPICSNGKSEARTKPAANKTAKAPAPAKAPAKAAAKKAAPAQKAVAPETITLKAVFEEIADGQKLPRKQVQAIMSAMITSVSDHLKKGKRIRMFGLGILEVKEREARMGRNPATGEAMQIAASKKIAFRPAKELKEAI
jgi:DNA-binding protein HU-beta